jgi:hypothetical protein
LVNGQPFSLVSVTKAKNFASLSLGPLRTNNDPLAIEFRPRKVVVPKDVIPTVEDRRTLGVGLHRIRVRSVRTT